MTDVIPFPVTDPTVPPDVAKRIRAQERQLKREEKAAIQARATWRRNTEEALIKALRLSLRDLWDTTDLEARLLSGHMATVGIHTVAPDQMQELEEKTAQAIAEQSKPQLYDGRGNPV